MDFFDSKKHSGVIAYFQKNYVKTGVFDVQYSHIIETAFRMRNKSDYDDFYVINIDEAKEQFEKAKIFIMAVDNYLQEMYKSNSGH